MYSMKRSVWPVPRKCSASATSSPSLTPRLTTQFTFTGSPAAAAASMPSSTRPAGKSTSFSAWNVASSSESRLTVIRPQARLRERLGLGGQQRAVRGQGQVGAERREQLDQPLEVAAHERLAAGDAELLDAERHERLRDPRDLLEAEQLLAVEEAVGAAEDLLRHAVDAAEVAAVGDRDPQVVQRPSQRVRDAITATA